LDRIKKKKGLTAQGQKPTRLKKRKAEKTKKKKKEARNLSNLLESQKIKGTTYTTNTTNTPEIGDAGGGGGKQKKKKHKGGGLGVLFTKERARKIVAIARAGRLEKRGVRFSDAERGEPWNHNQQKNGGKGWKDSQSLRQGALVPIRVQDSINSNKKKVSGK